MVINAKIVWHIAIIVKIHLIAIDVMKAIIGILLHKLVIIIFEVVFLFFYFRLYNMHTWIIL